MFKITGFLKSNVSSPGRVQKTMRKQQHSLPFGDLKLNRQGLIFFIFTERSERTEK